ncbi:MAG: ABC transporter ATP-binding protein [Lachnospiraceae bacterium]|nr:ABC transporter ATP-binding protein [Lachnospiraceae bacterium]
MSEYSIMAEKISMKYRLPAQKVDNLKEYVIRLLKRNLQYKEFLALDEVSFNACAGDRIGILGLNGAGKSTLSKIVAGVLKPSCGKIYRKGKIAPLIELGAGFEQQYTGRENIFLYGSMLGYKKEYIASKLDEIIDFSELGDFIDIPLKNYSSGMKARLGFSIATACEPDILILDEVLSVGDAKFRKKSEQKVKSMMKEDTTVLFVSHSLSQVEAICNKVMILDHGKCIFLGDVKEGIAKYEEIIA